LLTPWVFLGFLWLVVFFFCLGFWGLSLVFFLWVVGFFQGGLGCFFVVWSPWFFWGGGFFKSWLVRGGAKGKVGVETLGVFISLPPLKKNSGSSLLFLSGICLCKSKVLFPERLNKQVGLQYLWRAHQGKKKSKKNGHQNSKRDDGPEFMEEDQGGGTPEGGRRL